MTRNDDVSDDSDDDDNDPLAALRKRRNNNAPQSRTSGTQHVVPVQGSLAALALTRPRMNKNEGNRDSLAGWGFLQSSTQACISPHYASGFNETQLTGVPETGTNPQHRARRSQEDKERERQQTLQKIRKLERQPSQLPQVASSAGSVSAIASSPPAINRRRGVQFVTAGTERTKEFKRPRKSDSKHERRRRKEWRREECRQEKNRTERRRQEESRHENRRREARSQYPGATQNTSRDPILEALRAQQRPHTDHRPRTDVVRKADRQAYRAIKHTPIMASTKAKTHIEEIKRREQRAPRRRGQGLSAESMEKEFQRMNVVERERKLREQRRGQQVGQEQGRHQPRGPGYHLTADFLEEDAEENGPAAQTMQSGQQTGYIDDPVEHFQQIVRATQPQRRTTQIIPSLPNYNYQEEYTRQPTHIRGEDALRTALLQAKNPVREANASHNNPGQSNSHLRGRPLPPPPFYSNIPRRPTKPKSKPRTNRCKRCYGLHKANCSGAPNCNNCRLENKICKSISPRGASRPRLRRPSPAPALSAPSTPPPPDSSCSDDGDSPPSPPVISAQRIPASMIIGPDGLIAIYTVLRTRKALAHPGPGSQIRVAEFFSLDQANRFALGGIQKPKKDVVGRRWEIVTYEENGTPKETGYGGGAGMAAGYFEGEVAYSGGEEEMWWVVKEVKDLKTVEKKRGKEVMVDEEMSAVYKRIRWDVWVVVGKVSAWVREEGREDKIEKKKEEEEEEGHVFEEEQDGEEGGMDVDKKEEDGGAENGGGSIVGPQMGGGKEHAEAEDGDEKVENVHVDGENGDIQDESTGTKGQVIDINEEENDAEEENDHAQGQTAHIEEGEQEPLDRARRLRQLLPFYSQGRRKNDNTDDEGEEGDEEDDIQPDLDPSLPLLDQIEWEPKLHNSYTAAAIANQAALNIFCEIAKPRVDASPAANREFNIYWEQLQAQFKEAKLLDIGCHTGVEWSWEPPAELAGN